MPVYDFKCPECGLHFEELVPMGTSHTECKCKASASKIFAATSGIIMGVTNNDKSIRDKMKNDARSPSSGITFDNGRKITG